MAEKGVVGLIADPGLATDIAHQLATQLPQLLTQRVSDRLVWAVSVVTEDIAVGDQRLIDRADQRRRTEGWDYAICLTDLPLRSGRRPLIADVSTQRHVAVVSLPAFGGILAYEQVREMVVQLIAELHGEEPKPGDVWSGRLFRWVTPLRRVTPSEDDVSVRFTAGNSGGRLRLLAGMVRVNRPWRLALGLSRALAAALATGALASMNGIVWQVSNDLGWARLLGDVVLAVATMVAWLIFYHDMWRKPSSPLYNAATTISLVIGVSTLWLALFVLDLVAQVFVIGTTTLAEVLRHPVGPSDYVKLALLVSSIATIGGALGSGLETRGAVRTATYGIRSRGRSSRQ